MPESFSPSSTVSSSIAPITPLSADRRQRLADFYRALLDTGKAIRRQHEPLALYEAVCRIAVESGGAAMAWAGLLEGVRVVPVAWGGPGRAYTDGLEISLETPAGQLPGPTATAIQRGEPCVCNDFRHDSRTAAWRERAARFEIGASAAFPVRRSGVVVAALNLYFAEPNAFDADLIELVEQMVSDLGFALEHIEREQALARSEREVREREQQLAGIVETALDAIITVDAQLRIVVFNRSASEMFGVQPEEALGGTVDRFIPPEYREAHNGYISRFASQGVSSRPMGRSRELAGMRANGEVFPMEASISRTGEGDRLLLTMMARDVTQERLAEKAQLAQAAAEAANRAKTEFLSRISHELRTPLNAVLGFAQLLREDRHSKLTPTQRQQVDLVFQAGEHLRGLIDELLDVSRIEAGRMAMEPRDFELCELLEAVLQMCRPQAESCGVLLESRYGGCHTMPMRNDPVRLRQVLLNLLSNGIKYNRPGGWVRIELACDDYFVHITVRDNGLGMTEAQQAGLFEPFNRLGRERSGVEGTGIGLVLVRQLVGLMGGSLALESQPGVGTSVRVTFPASDGRAMVPPPPAVEEDDAAVGPRGRVLCVEDNPVNAMLVEQLLSRWPQVSLKVAVDGAGALALAREWQPDVVLLDMQLPDTSGLAVLRALMSSPETRDVTVVGLSANALVEEIEAVRAAGAVDYWTKPIDFAAFIEGMRRLLPNASAPATPASPAPAASRSGRGDAAKVSSIP